MQKELEQERSEHPIQILGVNQVGHEGGNPSITTDWDLPWLQETGEADVWGAWHIAYRDVVVVGPDNHIVEVFNLTKNDLGVAENYSALKDLLLSVSPQ